jgi:hypothetical protein
VGRRNCPTQEVALSAYISFGGARSLFHIPRRGSHDPATLAAVHTRTLNVSYFTSVFHLFNFLFLKRKSSTLTFGRLLANYSSFDALGRRFPCQFDPLTALFRDGVRTLSFVLLLPRRCVRHSAALCCIQ